MTEEKEFCWGHMPDEDAERWSGSFETREEAEADGRSEYDHDFCVVKGQRIHPEEYAAAVMDFNYFLEQMEEQAYDDCAVSDALFCLEEESKTTEAQQELRAVVGAWAKKWLRCSYRKTVEGPFDIENGGPQDDYE